VVFPYITFCLVFNEEAACLLLSRNWNFIYHLQDFQALKFNFFENFSSIKLFKTLHRIDTISIKIAASIVGVDNVGSGIFDKILQGHTASQTKK
jgi:hypothetical protein